MSKKKQKGALFAEAEIESYSDKYVEFLISGKRCEGKVTEQYKDDAGVWWIALDDFKFLNHCKAERKSNYMLRIRDISGYSIKE